MIKNPSKQEIINYFFTSLKILGVILGVIFIVQVINFLIISNNNLDNFLFGSFLGVIFSSVNIFCLGLVFYKLIICHKSKIWIVLPILSFLLLCALTGVIAQASYMVVFGFALGLCVPLLFAYLVKPA